MEHLQHVASLRKMVTVLWTIVILVWVVMQLVMMVRDTWELLSPGTILGLISISIMATMHVTNVMRKRQLQQEIGASMATGPDGLRAQLDWAFVADMEHSLGMEHIDESRMACPSFHTDAEIEKMTASEVTYAAATIMNKQGTLTPNEWRVLELLSEVNERIEERERVADKAAAQKDSMGRYIHDGDGEEILFDSAMDAFGVYMNPKEAMKLGYPTQPTLREQYLANKDKPYYKP